MKSESRKWKTDVLAVSEACKTIFWPTRDFKTDCFGLGPNLKKGWGRMVGWLCTDCYSFVAIRVTTWTSLRLHWWTIELQSPDPGCQSPEQFQPSRTSHIKFCAKSPKCGCYFRPTSFEQIKQTGRLGVFSELRICVKGIVAVLGWCKWKCKWSVSSARAD